jgi:hypothetical protein
MFPERNGAAGERRELVSPGENGSFWGGLATVDAGAGIGWLIEGDAAHGGAGFFLDFGFTVGAAAPGGKGETSLDGFL